MKNANKFNAKLFNTKLKYGWTKENFKDYFDLDEESFIQKMEKEFSHKAFVAMLTSMDRNEKRQRNSVVTSRNPIEVVIEEHIDVNEVNDATDTVEKSPSKVSTQSQINLVILQQKEKEVSDAICDLETNYQSLMVSRRDKLDELRELERQLATLQKGIEEVQKKAEVLILNLNCNLEEIHSKGNEISNRKVELEKIRADIQTFSIANIWLYSNGEIEIEYPQKIILPDSEEIYKKLRDAEEYQDMTIRQIKQLAKVIALTEMLQQNEIKFEIQFDEEIVKIKLEEYLVYNC